MYAEGKSKDEYRCLDSQCPTSTQPTPPRGGKDEGQDREEDPTTRKYLRIGNLEHNMQTFAREHGMTLEELGVIARGLGLRIGPVNKFDPSPLWVLTESTVQYCWYTTRELRRELARRVRELAWDYLRVSSQYESLRKLDTDLYALADRIEQVEPEVPPCGTCENKGGYIMLPYCPACGKKRE